MRLTNFFLIFFLFKFFVDYNIGVRYTKRLSFARSKDHTKPQLMKVVEFSINDKALVSAPRTIITFYEIDQEFYQYDTNFISKWAFLAKQWKTQGLKYLMLRHPIKPMLRYIKYLERTPGKKHLLKK